MKNIAICRACVLAAALAIGAASVQADTITRLCVYTNGGEKVVYDLPDKPQLSFEPENLVIKIGKNTSYMPMASLSHFAYETQEITTGIDAPEVEAPAVAASRQGMELTLRQGTNTLRIVTPEGKTIAAETIECATERTYSLASLPAGVYLVTINSLTYKIHKK